VIALCTQDLWGEVVDLARRRSGSYDTQAIVADIEAVFGPSSLREVPDEEIERLFRKHERAAGYDREEFTRITNDVDGQAP